MGENIERSMVEALKIPPSIIGVYNSGTDIVLTYDRLFKLLSFIGMHVHYSTWLIN